MIDGRAMSDLVKRLRELEDDVAMGRTSDRAIQSHLLEAAAEIERLRGLLAELTGGADPTSGAKR